LKIEDIIVIGTDSKLFFIAQDPFKPTIDGWLFFAVLFWLLFIDIQTIQRHIHIYLNAKQLVKISH